MNEVKGEGAVRISRKTALITGVTGQDGAYLAEFLLSKNYDVHGLVRYEAAPGTGNLQALGVLEHITLHHGDLTDQGGVIDLIKRVKPDDIYNLGAMSHVAVSFDTPGSTMDINLKGTLAVLDSVRVLDMPVRIYQASSSEMFGSTPPPQDENTAMMPCSPYGVSKLAAYHLGRVYRDSYGMHVSNGILFNHESPLRGADFVTQKIARGVAAIKAGAQDCLYLGNLDARRDWGHARDYVRGMWMMLQQDRPDDYVLATGESHSVRDFAQAAFGCVDVKIEWRGDGVDEVGMCTETGAVLVRVDAQFFRPREVHDLCGDATKARAVLGWQPEIGLKDLVVEMVGAHAAVPLRGSGADEAIQNTKDKEMDCRVACGSSQ